MAFQNDTPYSLLVLSHAKSEALFDQALRWIPGGVNSPVRAFRAVGGRPFFAESAKGAYIYDVDGNSYVDYVGTWGPAIHGHTFPPIIDAIKTVVDNDLLGTFNVLRAAHAWLRKPGASVFNISAS